MSKKYLVNVPRSSLKMGRVNLPAALCQSTALGRGSYPLYLEGHGPAGEGARSSNRSLTGMTEIFRQTGCKIGDRFFVWVDESNHQKTLHFELAEVANHEERAGRAWPILTQAAKQRHTLSYGDVAKAIGIHHRPLDFALGPIQDFCIAQNLPPLTSLVVQGGGDGAPGAGFIAWDLGSLGEGQDSVYAFNWDTVPNPFDYARGATTQDLLAEALVTHTSTPSDVLALVKTRGIAQAIFRKALLKAYACACAFCGLTFVEALTAAHICPWARCSTADRINVRNGLLLCSTHHALFDADQLTVTEDFHVEYVDPEKQQTPYSEADERVSVELHRKLLRLPSDQRLRPDPLLIRQRYQPR